MIAAIDKKLELDRSILDRLNDPLVHLVLFASVHVDPGQGVDLQVFTVHVRGDRAGCETDAFSMKPHKRRQGERVTVATRRPEIYGTGRFLGQSPRRNRRRLPRSLVASACPSRLPRF